jgi:hypothetical protein
LCTRWDDHVELATVDALLGGPVEVELRELVAAARDADRVAGSMFRAHRVAVVDDGEHAGRYSN